MIREAISKEGTGPSFLWIYLVEIETYSLYYIWSIPCISFTWQFQRKTNTSDNRYTTAKYQIIRTNNVIMESKEILFMFLIEIIVLSINI